MRRLIRIVAVAAVAWGVLVTLRIGGAPAVRLSSDLPGIGPSTMIEAQFSEPRRGLRKVRLELVQNERIEVLVEQEYATRAPWQYWGESTPEDSVSAIVGSDTIEGLKEGSATVRATAWQAGTWLRHPSPTVETIELPVRLTPPLIQVLSSQHYPNQGGVEAVVYRVGDSSVRDGVRVGDKWFPGYPLSGGEPRDRFAWFGIPHSTTDVAEARLAAEDDVGNRTERAFVDRLRPQSFRTDTIDVPDSFIERVAPEIESQTTDLSGSGSLLERYLRINRELRSENRARIAELSSQGANSFLWTRPFLPMPNAQVMANFGDHRTYRYDGAEVDEQDHLGIDLASVKRAEVPAGNDGVVLLAGYFGIYGNAVLVDHGYGLATLYGHLSSTAVQEGDRVRRGQTLGRSGTTGLAGGDHLHFGVFLHGLAVDPEEWWDPSWIQNRLARKLGAALPFQGTVR